MQVRLDSKPARGEKRSRSECSVCIRPLIGGLLLLISLSHAGPVLAQQSTGLSVHGVERPRPTDNGYDNQWIKVLVQKRETVITYSTIEEMVSKVLTRIGRKGCVRELTLYGHGQPGFFTTGNGQGLDFKAGTYIHYSLLRTDWQRSLAPLKGRFCEDGHLNLVACGTGAGAEGAELLFALAQFLQVSVRAPVDLVFGGRDYVGRFQEASPTSSAPPKPVLSEFSVGVSFYVALIRSDLRNNEAELTVVHTAASRMHRDLPPRQSLVQVSFAGNSADAFDAEVIFASVRSSKSELLRQLQEPQYDGMRAYIDKFYLTTESIMTFTAPSHPRPLILRNTKEDVFHNMYAFLDKIEKVSKLRYCIDLRVVSFPSAASVELSAGGAKKGEATTEKVFSNVYRGYYDYVIQKPGYKTVSGAINLVDEEGTLLECTLHRNNDKDGPLRCSLKVVKPDEPRELKH